MKETGVSTILKTYKVVAWKGTDQVGWAKSAERRVITVPMTVHTLENVLPPMFTFPRKLFRGHFIQTASGLGKVKVPNRRDACRFYDAVYFTYRFFSWKSDISSLRQPFLTFHHLWSKRYMQENWVILLWYPPQCSHRLQLLNLPVTFLQVSLLNWDHIVAKSHPGKNLAVFHFPKIIWQAFLHSLSPPNIKSGFMVTGISPFNPDKFIDDDFAAAFVTDRPGPNIS